MRIKKRSIKGLKEWREIEQELMKNSKFKKEAQLLEPQFEALKKIIDLRFEHNITQKELAKRIDTQQPSVARLERGLENPTIYFLSKIAAAFGKKLVISFK